MTETINSDNIDIIVEKISNLNINDETGEIKPIQDIVQDVPNAVVIRRSGRVINKPLRLTYEKQTTEPRKKETISNKRKMSVIKAPQKKAKDIIVNTNDNKEITIVLDVSTGCNLYNRRSVSSSSTKTKEWKEKMEQDINEIMDSEVSDLDKHEKLLDYRNSISHTCNFWMAKSMLKEYSNILRNNNKWKKEQQEIIDRYKQEHENEFKKQLTNELNRELQKLEQLEAVRDRPENNSKAKSISRSRSRSRSRSTSDPEYEPKRGGLYRKTKKTKKNKKVQKKQKSTKKYKKNKKVQKSTKKIIK